MPNQTYILDVPLIPGTGASTDLRAAAPDKTFFTLRDGAVVLAAISGAEAGNFTYDLAFTVNLTVVLSGGVASDVTVTFVFRV